VEVQVACLFGKDIRNVKWCGDWYPEAGLKTIFLVVFDNWEFGPVSNWPSISSVHGGATGRKLPCSGRAAERALRMPPPAVATGWRLTFSSGRTNFPDRMASRFWPAFHKPGLTTYYGISALLELIEYVPLTKKLGLNPHLVTRVTLSGHGAVMAMLLLIFRIVAARSPSLQIFPLSVNPKPHSLPIAVGCGRRLLTPRRKC